MNEIKIRTCVKCQRRKATQRHLLHFTHEGLKAVALKDSDSCRRCTVNEFKRRFDKYAYLITHVDELIVSINWQGFLVEYKKPEAEIIELLINLGLLVLESDGNWEVISDAHLPVNPRILGQFVYFADPHHAAQYAKERLKQVECDWSIRKIQISHSKAYIETLGYI